MTVTIATPTFDSLIARHAESLAAIVANGGTTPDITALTPQTFVELVRDAKDHLDSTPRSAMVAFAGELDTAWGDLSDALYASEDESPALFRRAGRSLEAANEAAADLALS